MIKNILIIGKTGSGKSALANVITGTNKFEESSGSTSKTKDIQTEVFEENGIKYQIIDTISINGTEIRIGEALLTLAKVFKICENGFNQILFIIGERFTKEELSDFNVLKEIFFDEYITKHTTIVKTKFPNFEDRDTCKKDIEAVTNENGELANLINSCQRKVIHIDNPSININGKNAEERININKEVRKESRKILLTHLATCQGIYKSKKIDEINKKIENESDETIIETLTQSIHKINRREISEDFKKNNPAYISYRLECICKDMEEIRKWDTRKVNKLKDIDKIIIFSKPIPKPKPWMISTLKWTNRTASAVGGSLLLVGTKSNDFQYTQAGGIIAIVSPFMESALSTLQVELEKDIEEQENFFEELEKLKNNYQELLGITNNYTRLNIYKETKKEFEDFKERVGKIERKLELIEKKGIDAEQGIENKLQDYCKNNWEEYRRISQSVEQGIEKLLKSMEEKQQCEAKVEVITN